MCYNNSYKLRRGGIIMIYLDIILKSLGIAAIITFMIILIWGFVVFNSIYGQLKYTNYILEKISHILNIETREDFAKKMCIRDRVRLNQ